MGPYPPQVVLALRTPGLGFYTRAWPYQPGGSLLSCPVAGVVDVWEDF